MTDDLHIVYCLLFVVLLYDIDILYNISLNFKVTCNLKCIVKKNVRNKFIYR